MHQSSPPETPRPDLSGEIEFWDQRADAEEYRTKMAITPDEYMAQEAWLSSWAEMLPDLSGKRVLDCGTGLGAIATWCAQRGGEVVGFDIAQGMSRLAVEYARMHGTEISMLASTFEELPLADHSIDVAVGQYILHHTDVDKSMDQLKRVVKPGGMALFVENMALNPIIRRYVTSSMFEEGVMREGSPEECPILPEKVARMEELCSEFRMHWPSFVFFEILCDRLPVVPRRFGQAIDDGLYAVLKRNPRALRNSYFAILEMHF